MSTQAMAGVLSLAGGGVAILLAAALMTFRKSRLAAERRAQVLRYADPHRSSPHPGSRSGTTSAIEHALDSVLTFLRIRPRMARELDRAGIPLSPAQWALATLAGFALAWTVFGLLTGSATLGLFLALVVTVVLPRLIVSRRESRRRRAFEEELPEFFLMMASALRSGLSFSQALEAVARDGGSEVDRQMRRAVTEVSMGVPPDQALAAVADRMESEDMRWAVVALSIQKEVGGNLSSILDSVAETVRTRADIDREVRTLSAEGRLSALVLVALPLVIFLVLALLRPDYVSIFWSTTLGRVMLASTAVLFVVGVVWMRSIVRVRV